MIDDVVEAVDRPFYRYQHGGEHILTLYSGVVNMWYCDLLGCYG